MIFPPISVTVNTDFSRPIRIRLTTTPRLFQEAEPPEDEDPDDLAAP